MIDLLRRLMIRLRPKARRWQSGSSDETVTLFEGSRQCVQFAWSEVQEVVTFKRDCLTYDDIRLGFRIADGWIEISEDSEGWSDLTPRPRERISRRSRPAGTRTSCCRRSRPAIGVLYRRH